MIQQKIQKLKTDLQESVRYLKSEFSKLQAGRANPSLIEDIEVDCYGQKYPLKQLASIQIPEPRMIVVRPWDKSSIPSIESAIRKAGGGLSPVSEEDFIRVAIPSLSEERRKELIKIVQDKTEEVRISVRRQRGDVWDDVQEMERNKEITEDEKFRAKDKLQEVIDDVNKQIDEMSKEKEKELMTI